MSGIQLIAPAQLRFDRQNPRLAEVDIREQSSEDYIINLLWTGMAIDEIVMSILAQGFFEYEPLYAIQENHAYTIIEGNRRLAAVKAILNPSLVKNNGMKRFRSKIDDVKEELYPRLENGIPVVVVGSREDAWRFIGFKHVNGAAKWDSYAKAKYIAQVHNEYKVDLDDIATQIGDANKTVKKLYQGLMVLEQAHHQTEFKIDDIYNSRIFFSYIYTAITLQGFQNYLGIDTSFQSANPVASENLKKTGRCYALAVWQQRERHSASGAESEPRSVKTQCHLIQ